MCKIGILPHPKFNIFIVDFSSRTVINPERNEPTPTPSQSRRFSRWCDATNYPITTNRFLTGSQAFKNFMKNNKNVITTQSTSKLPKPSLLNG